MPESEPEVIKSDTSAGHDTRDGIDRREALIKFGKYSAFTAPAMATLLLADEAAAFSGSGAGGVQPGKGKPKKPQKPKKPKKPKKK